MNGSLPISSKLPDVGTTIFTVMSRLAEEHGAVNLGQGFPDFEPPESLRRSLGEHIARGANQYAPMAGLLRLRQAIARRIAEDYGHLPDAEQEITVTSGATEGIFDAIAAVVAAGDEVVVFDPSYDSYDPAVRLQNARCVHVRMSTDFRIDFDALKAALSPRTRLLILNFPHNPSGATLHPGELDELATLLRDRPIFVLSDEVYEHLVYDGARPLSVLSHAELRERALVVGSFGKAYHCTGWKVGWVTAPAALTAELRKVHQFVTFATSTAAQHAFADALEQDAGHLRGLAPFYQQKRDKFRSLLAGSAFEVLPVTGAYFQLVDYSRLSQEPDEDFARRLVRDALVASIPISGLCEQTPSRRLIRFCFAKRESTLELAAERLQEFSRRHVA